MGMKVTDPLLQLNLPAGFRFYPTDEELLVKYLCRKIAGLEFELTIIGEVDLYQFDPWVLPDMAMFGEKEWYFFSPRDRKYPNGSRPNRVAGSGYWKATGTDKVITAQGRKLGIKKALVFYVGKAPKGSKTNWIMHEYRLSDAPRKEGSLRLDDWVLCRIYKKITSAERAAAAVGQSKEQTIASSSSSTSHLDEMQDSFPEIDDGFFSLPMIEHDEKQNPQELDAGNFDWLPDLVPAAKEIAAVQMNGYDVNYQNDFYAQAMSMNFQAADDEVQPGIKSPRVENSGFFEETFPGISFFNVPDPFGFQYPDQSTSMGFMQ